MRREYGIKYEVNAKEMTLNYERRNAVNRTRELLIDILSGKYPEVAHRSELWHEVRSCLKHYPGEYYMELAQEQAPEIFGDWEFYQDKS